MASATFLMALLRDNLRMGPIVNARMTAAALMGLPYGVAFAGAQATIQAVEAGETAERYRSIQHRKNKLRQRTYTAAICNVMLQAVRKVPHTLLHTWWT